jgi:hypothetical protein
MAGCDVLYYDPTSPAAAPMPAGGRVRPPGRSGPTPTRWWCGSSATPTAASWSPSTPLGWLTASAGADPVCRSGRSRRRAERLWTCASSTAPARPAGPASTSPMTRAASAPASEPRRRTLAAAPARSRLAGLVTAAAAPRRPMPAAAAPARSAARVAATGGRTLSTTTKAASTGSPRKPTPAEPRPSNSGASTASSQHCPWLRSPVRKKPP